MPEQGRLAPGEPRSAGSISHRRVPQAWPADRRFRILSIDGGGIRGIFPAAILARLELEHAARNPIGTYFDLIAGTSTGGILALGLGAGLSANVLLAIYLGRGDEIFPPLGSVGTWLRNAYQFAAYSYDRAALESVLTDTLGDRLFGESRNRLCIPSFDGRHSEVFVFKTPHHPDYRTDRYQRMVDVGLATSAAPTYFRPLDHGGYRLVDGGVWANNPTMIGVIEALTCFTISPDQIDVLSLGCGNEPYVVSNAQTAWGGLWHWRSIIHAAMRLQALAATNQARLLLGPPAVTRIDPPNFNPPILMDDYARSVELLIPAVEQVLSPVEASVAATYLREPTACYIPVRIA